MTAKQVPEGFTVYERKFPGYTKRVAVRRSDLRVNPDDVGFILSDDQESPVYDVMVKHSDGTVYHGGQNAENIPMDARVGAQKLAEEYLGIKGSIANAFEFTEAHKRLALEGKVSDEIAHYRLTVCTGTTQDGAVVSGRCPNYVNENSVRGSGHCKGCGCPEWKVAEMNRPKDNGKGVKFFPGKVWYPMGCPKGRFSEQSGRRANAT